MAGKSPLVVALVLVLAMVGATGCSTSGGQGDGGGPATPVSVSGVVWSPDWDEVLSRAQAEDKMMMINFYTDICPACRKLDQDTFADVTVGAYINANFVPLKSNLGKSDLHRQYGIPAVPITVFATPEGREIGRIIGYRPPDVFYQGATTVLAYWQERIQGTG